jgi:hypothetical protein
MGGEGMNAIKLATLFHELYEQYAPEYGYETKNETKVFKAYTPNGKLMIRVCREIQKIVKVEEQP